MPRRAVTEPTARRDPDARPAFAPPATNLPDRADFLRHLKCALARAECPEDHVAVLFVGLDRFDAIAASLGDRREAEEILLEAGRRIQACLDPETTIARLGSAEFGILLEGVAEFSGATSVAERIAAQLAMPFSVGAREAATTVSMAITLIQKQEALRSDLRESPDEAGVIHA